jgi:hypothetical protein
VSTFLQPSGRDLESGNIDGEHWSSTHFLLSRYQDNRQAILKSLIAFSKNGSVGLYFNRHPKLESPFGE